MEKYILGAGMTGLAAGMSSGIRVLEAEESPGGICSSYYMRPGEKDRLSEPPSDGDAFRFEIGGGHWIFGGDPLVLDLIRRLVPVKKYVRRSSVYFSDQQLFVPYPIQNNLRYLDPKSARNIISEIGDTGGPSRTLKEWTANSFGPTLSNLFFHPFHERYTAGLYDQITPQDSYKSPVNRAHVLEGAESTPSAVGYNVEYIYPRGGLDNLARNLASRCNVLYGKRITEIDLENKTIRLSNKDVRGYRQLISTLPLNTVMRLSGLEAEMAPDPATSVLVLNIGAERGPGCPDAHWLYIPDSKSGFHRLGFYSNVDKSFLPASSRAGQDRVSIYVETAYRHGKPTDIEIEQYSESVISELQDWGFTGKIETVDPTWIEVAYTWSYPDSAWRKQALEMLRDRGIFQVGRYGRWIFQGIADSIRDGLVAGSSFAK